MEKHVSMFSAVPTSHAVCAKPKFSVQLPTLGEFIPAPPANPMTEHAHRKIAVLTVSMAGKACPAYLGFTPVRIPGWCNFFF